MLDHTDCTGALITQIVFIILLSCDTFTLYYWIFYINSHGVMWSTIMNILRFSVCSCLIIINPTFALDFDKAWKNNRFREIDSNFGQWTVHPEKEPSVSLYYDKYRRNTEPSDSTETNYTGSQWTSENPTKRIEITLGNFTLYNVNLGSYFFT